MRWTRATELALVLASTAAVVLPLGCRGTLDPPVPTAHPGDSTPQRGGTLSLAAFQDIATLDPALAADALSSSAVRMIYAGLVDFDAQGNVVPELAERFEISDDGLTYRFTLREGLVFQDGAPLTATDVKRSIERALAPATASPLASFYDSIDGFDAYEAKRAEHLAGVAIDGARVVALHLSQRDAKLLAALGMTALRPVCPSADDGAGLKPCGAGPFAVPEGGWQRGQELRLVRNDRYFVPGRPYLDGVRWELGVNVVSEGLKFARGELDVVRDLTQVDTLRYLEDPRWAPFGEYEPAHSMSGDAMNVEMPPFDRAEVRRAVASAIDRESITMLKTTNLTVVNKPVPPGMPGYAPDVRGQTYDPAAALEHMRRAGLAYDPATGSGGWPATIPYTVYRGLPEMVGQVIQQDLARIGLRVQLRTVSLPTFYAITQRRGQSPISPQGYAEDYPDPSDFLEPLFTRAAINDEATNNHSFYVNDRLEAILSEARGMRDRDGRMRRYAEAEQIVCDDAPWAFEYAYRFFHVHQPYVRGYRVNPVWATDVNDVWLDRASRAAPVLGALLP